MFGRHALLQTRHLEEQLGFKGRGKVVQPTEGLSKAHMSALNMLNMASCMVDTSPNSDVAVLALLPPTETTKCVVFSGALPT